MFVWELVEETEESINDKFVETVQTTVDNRFHTLISVTSNQNYWINILDLDNNQIVYNGVSDSLVAILNAIQQFEA